jgi:hypothetical protein
MSSWTNRCAKMFSRDAGKQAQGWPLAAGNGPYDDKGLRPRGDRIWQRGIWQLMGKVLLTGEEPQERTALLRDVIADRAAQRGIAGLECVKDRALRGRTLDVELHLAAKVRQRPKMSWE